MNVYTVIATDQVDAAASAVALNFPQDNFKVAPNVWMVAGTGTAQDISARLGMPVTQGVGSNFSAIITLVNGYYGYAPTNIWEWLAAKQAAPVV